MRVAILGGGQLARMLGLAGYGLGLQFRCLDPVPRSCASDVMEQLTGAWDDPLILERLLEGADCVTFETENIPLKALDLISTSKVPCYPSYEALRLTQDRLLEKEFLRSCGMQTASYAAPNSRAELIAAGQSLGFPLLVKTRRMGYDGKGQRLARDPEGLLAAWDELGGEDLILEGLVPFEAEGSLLGVRDAEGHCLFYPVVRNEHRQGILLSSQPWLDFPKPALAELQQKLAELMQRLDYRGVLALEFFLWGSRVVANELAPRVHNSGHWTQHAAITSQFENHLRAICGWSLGSTAQLGHFRMLNLLGQIPDHAKILACQGARLSDYRKSAAPGRKVGHVTLLQGADTESFENDWQRLRTLAGVG